MTRILAWVGEGGLREDVPLADLPALLADPRALVWLDLGPGDALDAERLLRDVVRIHPLAVEDCLSPREQPKVDDYGDYLFLVTHGVTADGGEVLFRSLELDAVLGARLLVTHHTAESRSVTETWDNVCRAGVPLRRGTAAVLHEIIDRQIDHYWPVLEEVEHRLDDIEDALFEHPRQTLLEEILALKRGVLALRRSVVKQRDVVHRLARREFSLIPDADAWMFRDVEDHLNRAADLLETYRELLAGAVEVYMSVTSNRLNEVVKVLTIFSTLVLPLSLIASIYGMNFHHMPELGWRYGYPFALGLMGVVVVLLLVFFWRRGWLTNAASRRRAPPVILPRAAARLDAETRRRVRAKHAGPHEAPAADARVAATAPSRRG